MLSLHDISGKEILFNKFFMVICTWTDYGCEHTKHIEIINIIYDAMVLVHKISNNIDILDLIDHN